MTSTIHYGDCLEVLRTLPESSVDAVVTDPPAGIGFMGKSWDKDKGGRREWVAWLTEIMAECHRVMKPGAYALVWALPRTSHWTGWAIEDGGLLIQDRISHLFGTGFPKSKTHLKPACEDWWLAYKKGERALNIDGCRVGTDEWKHPGSNAVGGCYGDFTNDKPRSGVGRWPANVTHDGSDEVVGLFPVVASGIRQPTGKPEYTGSLNNSAAMRGSSTLDTTVRGHADTGSAARFFYCAKASKADREEGLADFPSIHRANGNKWTDQDYRVARGERPPSAESGPRRNHHPTCKSTELMSWLCRLITPPGGVILDPFMGSGSTGKAAALEGFSFLGVEREVEYVEIARARIAHAQGTLFAEAAG